MTGLEYLDLLERDETRDLVLGLMVHVAFSDGIVHEDEFTLLQELMPRRDPNELLDWVHTTAEEPLDHEALARALPDEADRWKTLRFAAQMAWTDRQLNSSEVQLLVSVAAGLGFGLDAVETVLNDLVGRVHAKVTTAEVDAALAGMRWEELVFVPGPPHSGLARVVPGGAVVRGCLLLDGVERIAIGDTGFAASFREGEAWVGWNEVRSYSRVPVFGAALRLETRDFRARTLGDVRLRVVGALLDRVYGGARTD
jgi:hypothetical protein